MAITSAGAPVNATTPLMAFVNPNPPLTTPLAVILLGGLRELTALAVEDGRPVREIVEPAVDASIALLGGPIGVLMSPP